MYFRWDKEALYLDCSIQPRSKTDEIVGVVGDRLKVRISAVPADGKANKQIVRFLAKLFHTKQAAVTIVSGQTSRHKRLCISKPLTVPPELEISRDGDI